MKGPDRPRSGYSYADDASVPLRMLRMWRAERQRDVMCSFVFIVALLAATVGIGGYEVVQLTYRSGHAGVAGTVGPVHCRVIGTGRDAHTGCAADFTTADGFAVITGVVVENGNGEQAARTPARLHSDNHTASITGKKPVLHTAALLGIALLAGRWTSVTSVR